MLLMYFCRAWTARWRRTQDNGTVGRTETLGRLRAEARGQQSYAASSLSPLDLFFTVSSTGRIGFHHHHARERLRCGAYGVVCEQPIRRMQQTSRPISGCAFAGEVLGFLRFAAEGAHRAIMSRGTAQAHLSACFHDHVRKKWNWGQWTWGKETRTRKRKRRAETATRCRPPRPSWPRTHRLITWFMCSSSLFHSAVCSLAHSYEKTRITDCGDAG